MKSVLFEEKKKVEILITLCVGYIKVVFFHETILIFLYKSIPRNIWRKKSQG